MGREVYCPSFSLPHKMTLVALPKWLESIVIGLQFQHLSSHLLSQQKKEKKKKEKKKKKSNNLRYTLNCIYLLHRFVMSL